MHIDRDGDLTRFPLQDAIDGETFEERMRRSRQASEVAELESELRAVAPDADDWIRAEKQREYDRYQRDQARMNHYRIPLGHTGVGYHTRAKVARPATAGKW